MDLKNAVKSSGLSIVIILLILVYGLAYNAPQYLYIYAIDSLARGKFIQFLILQLGQFIIGVLGAVILGINTIVFERFIQGYLQELRSKLSRNYYLSSLTDLNGIENDLFNNLNMIKETGANNLFNLLNQIAIILFSGIFLLTINYWYLIVITILATVSIFLPKLLDKKLNLSTKRVSEANQQFLETINAWLDNLYELTTFNAFKLLSQKIANSSSKLELATVHNKGLLSLSLFLNGAANSISQFIVLGLGGYLFFSNNISLGSWTAANDFSFAIFSAVLTLTNLSNQINSVRELNHTIKQKVEKTFVRVDDEGQAPAAFMIRSLSYQYGEKKLAFPDFKVEAGEKILLKGPSGSGKTTLLKLLIGQLTAKSGQITFIDQAGHEVKPDYHAISYLPQKVKLFPDTVVNNVTMFNSDLTLKAKQLLGQMQFNLDPELQLKTAGDNISGGQQQLIVLARGQLHQTKLLLLDEAISAIDSQTVPVILEQLLKHDGRTVLMIEHNITPEQEKKFDRVIELKQRGE